MSTFSNQSSLPHLPVPTLEHTIARYLRSLIPILSPEELQKTTQLANDFLASDVSKELQAKMHERAQKYDNWLEPWWDSLGYFCARIPLLITTNPGLVIEDPPVLQSATSQFPPHRVQAWRAAQIIHGSLLFMKEIFAGTLQPDKNSCMSQYARIFGTSRIPAPNCDRLVNYLPPVPGNPRPHFLTEYEVTNPRHVVVIANGHFFSIEVLSESGEVLQQELIEGQIAHVQEMGRSRPTAVTEAISVLTAIDRDEWTRARDALVKASPLNVKSLERIQEALLVLALDDSAPCCPTETVSHTMMGNPSLRWFDKHTVIVYANGKAGINFEHGAIDGMTLVTMADYVCALATFNQPPQESLPSKLVPKARPLQWFVTPVIERMVLDASHSVALAIKEIDIVATHFTDFGRSHIKHLRCSPDSFFQMAIQLGYYRAFGMCVPTYESAATRQFLHGRTETLRSCTAESADFVRAMDRPTILEHRKLQQQRVALRRALQAHSSNIRDATNGQGVDRHLLGLSLLASEAGLSVPFLKDPNLAFSKSWFLSTSSMPTNEVVAFGPVIPKGYGVYYCFPKNAEQVRFTVTSYHGDNRPALVLSAAISQAMRDMAFLLATESNL